MHDALQPSLISVQDEVRAAFGWSEEADAESAIALLEFLKDHDLWTSDHRRQTLTELRSSLQNASRIVIIGAAVEKSEIEDSFLPGDTYVAADGAVGALDSYENLACVVSDFDGGEHLHKAACSGQTIVAHAHGDNLPGWQNCLNKWQELSLPPSLVPSHQTNRLFPEMYNFGGFTDGDRALCMVLSCGVAAEKIHLIGFAANRVGTWSGATVRVQKLLKLKWMERILSELGFEKFVRK